MNKFVFFICLLTLCMNSYSDSRIIAIEGFGSFEYPAEMIRIDFSVYNQSKRSIQEAKAGVDRASTAIVKSLLKLGVSEDDIYSPSFRVDSEEHYDFNNCPKGAVPIVGRDMEVLVRDLSIYRKVIDALVNNGATSISNVQSDVIDIKKYEQRAMLAAIENAKKQARFLVENLGAKLGPVHRIGEKRIRNNSRIEEIMVAGVRASASDEIPYEFQAQPVEVSANIYVEFFIE